MTAAPSVVVTASIDTEEDNWVASRSVTLRNIAELPRMHRRMSGLGLRMTYFTAYSVVEDPSTAAIMRDLRGDGTEIGAHLHPWNTPPIDEEWVPRNTMLKNLSGDLQRRKIELLTERITEQVGVRPTAFRAGRFALGPSTVAALADCGYRVDSSVMPGVDWSGTDDGPDFRAAPLSVYRVAASSDVTTPAADGPLVEVPLSIGYNRWPFDRWARVQQWLSAGLVRRSGLGALASRAGLVRKVTMSPEGNRTRDVIQLARLLVQHGQRHVQIIWHSPSIVPGLTPFCVNAAEVEQFYRLVADVVEGLTRFASVTFATVSETARLLDPAGGQRF